MRGMIGEIRFDKHGNVEEKLVISQIQTSPKTGWFVSKSIGHWDPRDESVSLDFRNISWEVFEGGSKTDHNNSSSAVTSLCALPCSDNEYIIPGDVECCWTCQIPSRV